MIVYGLVVLRGEHYYLISLGVIFTWLASMVLSWESERKTASYLTGISIFVVIAVFSRLLLAPIPQVKPIAAIVIIGGAAFGKSGGAMIGIMSMFLSNFLFMQGTWTPFQMFAMGLIGYLAGLFFYKKSIRGVQVVPLILYGFFSVLILYGGIVDINTLFFTLGKEPGGEGVLAVYLSGLPFDLIFAVSTAVFLLLLVQPIMKIWNRLAQKYD